MDRSKLSILSATIGLIIGFDLGFTIVVLSLKYMLGVLNPETLRVIAGISLILMGLYLASGKELPVPDLKLNFKFKNFQGVLGGFLLGLGLAVSWSPCAGPVLAGIISMIATQSSLIAFSMLASFLMGMDLGFLILALFITPIWAFLKSGKLNLNWVNRTSGILIILIGAWLLSSLKLPEVGANLESLLGYKLGLGVAFLAGVLTFLSPCTLPMMPIALVGLTGLSASQVLTTSTTTVSTSSLLPPDEALKAHLISQKRESIISLEPPERGSGGK